MEIQQVTPFGKLNRSYLNTHNILVSKDYINAADNTLLISLKIKCKFQNNLRLEKENSTTTLPPNPLEGGIFLPLVPEHCWL